MSDITPWRGYWPAATTPFEKAGPLDEIAWREQIDLYTSFGVHGVLVNGSSGEWFAQTLAERKRVAEIAVEQVNGAYPVVVGCSSFTPDAVVQLADHAAAAGADGVLFTPPPYAAPNEREIFLFYEEVAARTSIPIMVYNWPRGISLDMSQELLGKLARLDGVVSIKDSTPDYGRHLETLAALGSESVFFANYISRLGIGVMTELGGSGSIEGGALCAAEGIAFFNSFWAGDLEAARMHATVYEAQLASFIGYNFGGRFGSQIPQIKAAMRMLGQPGGYSRRPYQELDEAGLAGLRANLVAQHLL
ncbi:MAG: Dihydrodipicolinate synthase [Subtercola sp.]|nr:Dihydrodipicolinate synthase [Subtercola sp.]